MSERVVPSRRKAALLRGIRRMHLYCGLVMLPWVLLYAVSGLLFNHPALSGSEGTHRFERDDIPSEIAARFPDATVATDHLVRALRQARPEHTIEVQRQPAPAFTGSLRARGKLPDAKVGLFLGMETGNGVVRVTAVEPEITPPALQQLEALEVDGLGPEVFEGIARDLTTQMAPDTTELSLSSAPTLRFVARIDGDDWVLEFDPKAQTLAAEPVDASSRTTWARVLARLHMTHAYPSSFGAAWIHALIVDLTIACLLLWCLTGLVMWWQLRRLRRIGWVWLLSGLAATTWLLVLVWPSLTG